MRCLLWTILFGVLAFPTVLGAQAPSDEPTAPSEPAADKSAAQKAVDLALERGVLWLSKQQCVNCHFSVPGKPPEKHTKLSDEGFKGSQIAISRDHKLVAQDVLSIELSRTSTCTRVERPGEQVAYLGVSLADVPDVVRRHVSLPRDMGLLVETVDPGSPASVAGLKQHDLLLKIDEQLLINPEQFSVLIRTYAPGSDVQLTAVQASKSQVLKATLGKRRQAEAGEVLESRVRLWSLEDGALEARRFDRVLLDRERTHQRAVRFLLDPSKSNFDDVQVFKSSDLPRKKSVAYLGVHTADVSEALAKQLCLPPGTGRLIESVEENTAAAQAGLKPFDVLRKLDDQLLVNSEQFTVLIRAHAAGDKVKLALIREGKPQEVSIVLGTHEIHAESGEWLGEVTGAVVADRMATNQGALWLLTDQHALWSGKQMSAETTDAEFIRRAYLDILGVVPPPDAVRAFVELKEQDKRRRLIDSLTARPEAISRASGSAAAKWSDAAHTLSLVWKKEGRELVVQESTGKVLFEGPIDTAEQRRRVPAEVSDKLEILLKSSVEPAQAASVQELLDRVLPRVEFDEVPLVKALDQLREQAGANIVVHWKALQAAGVSADEPVSLVLRDARVSTVLSTLLLLAGDEQGKLSYRIEGEAIIISTKR